MFFNDWLIYNYVYKIDVVRFGLIIIYIFYFRAVSFIIGGIGGIGGGII